MKLTTILVLKIRLEILYFQTFNINEMQHQQNHIWFKGKKLENNAHKCHICSICFRNHVNRIIDTSLLFMTKLFQKA